MTLESEIYKYSQNRIDIQKELTLMQIPHNDNIIGRIGEYRAASYFISKGQNPVFSRKSNEEGYDFKINHIRYSVKTITSENNIGSTSPLTLARKWGYLVAVKLDSELKLAAIAVVPYTKVRQNLDNNSIKQGRIPTNKKQFRWWTFLESYRLV